MTPAQAAIAVVGSLNLDQVVRVPRLPGPGETVAGDDEAGRELLASLEEAARRAVRVAAAACLRQGAQASLPAPADLRALPGGAGP